MLLAEAIYYKFRYIRNDGANMFDAFISYKKHDADGNITKDREMAESLHKALQDAGIDAFYSDCTLSSLGVAEYKKAIDDALDDAKILIAVGTSSENLLSGWVRYEWDGFFNDILSGKKEGRLFTYIDDMAVVDLPRSLRQLQVFEAREVTIAEIVDYVSSSLVACSGAAKAIQNKSTRQADNHPKIRYSYSDSEEARRLKSQAMLVLENDAAIISGILSELPSEKTISVLDLGCSDGYLTKQLFGKFADCIKIVVGIDRDNLCIQQASLEQNDLCEFYCLDVEEPDFDQAIHRIMDENEINQFDFVFSALTLHHLEDRKAALIKLRKILRKGGILYVRTCDDGEIFGYPDDKDLIQSVLRKTQDIVQANRNHGRMMFSELYKAGFKDIAIQNYYVTTAEMDADERYEFYFDIFNWRKNRMKKRIEMLENKEIALNEYVKFCEMLDEIEEYFCDPSFYFCVAGPIAIGRR